MTLQNMTPIGAMNQSSCDTSSVGTSPIPLQFRNLKLEETETEDKGF